MAIIILASCDLVDALRAREGRFQVVDVVELGSENSSFIELCDHLMGLLSDSLQLADHFRQVGSLCGIDCL